MDGDIDPTGSLDPSQKVIGVAGEAASGVHEVPGMRLGRAPKVPGRRSLNLRDFVSQVPAHPIAVDDLGTVDYGLDMNDQFGVCVPTSVDNFRRMVTSLLTPGKTQVTTQDEIFDWYRSQNQHFSLDNYQEADDQGMVIQYFLEWLVAQGVVLGFASVDVDDLEMLKAATYLFLGLIVGVDLQTAQQNQTRNGGTWDYVNSPEWGGHAVMVGAYGTPWMECITWDQRVYLSPEFIDRQMDEAWVVILPEHVANPNFRAGFDLNSYAAAFEQITGKKFPVPTISPTPVQPPEPSPVLPPVFPGEIDDEIFSQLDEDVQEHILHASKTAGLVPWLNHHFRSYFKIK